MQSEDIIADTVGNCTPELQNSVKSWSVFCFSPPWEDALGLKGGQIDHRPQRRPQQAGGDGGYAAVGAAPGEQVGAQPHEHRRQQRA